MMPNEIRSRHPCHRLTRGLELEGRHCEGWGSNHQRNWEKTASTEKRALLARQMNDGLKMVGLRKQIDQMDPFDPVAAGSKNRQIARQCNRVAGDINNPWRAHGHQH